MSTSNDRSYEYDDDGKVKFVSLNVFGSADQPVRTDRDKFQRRKLKRDIESGSIDPNSVNENGGPLWHFICQRLDDDDVDWATSLFCREPVRIDARDNFGRTALHLAVYNDLERMTKLLLSEGANPNLANDREETPLHVICRIDKYEPAEASRNNSNVRENARRAQNKQRRFVERQERIIESLLERRADPNARDSNGFTPLHVVCQKKCDDDYVRSLTVTTRNDPWSLNLAAYRNYRSVIESMLRRDANPTLADAKGSTPLHIICQGYGDNHQLAETLFERYRPIPVDAPNANGETPLHLAVRAYNKQLVQWLLRKGADRTLTNSKGETPLHIVCQKDFDSADFASCIMTTESEYDNRRPLVQIDAQDNSNDAPLHLATSHGHLSLMSFLLKNGANPTLVNDKGETPLHNICRKGSDRCWPLLLFKICDERQLRVQVDARDTLGRTPLQWAVANFNLYLIDVLLDRGADLFSFVFPVERHFYERFRTNVEGQFESKVELASGIMMALEHLESKGWELELSDALTIMNVFANHGLFEESPAIEKCLNDEDFVCRMKSEMIKPNLSLYDLIQLRPKDAAKQLTCKDYFELVRSKGLGRTFAVYSDCFAHLCEKLSRKFFRSRALQPFQKLIHYRLPPEICEMIIDGLMNQDIYNICLAAVGVRERSERDNGELESDAARRGAESPRETGELILPAVGVVGADGPLLVADSLL